MKTKTFIKHFALYMGVMACVAALTLAFLHFAFDYGIFVFVALGLMAIISFGISYANDAAKRELKNAVYNKTGERIH